MEKPENIIFFDNGNTFAADKNGEQIAELQESWFRLYIDFLVGKGIDPTTLDYELPMGHASILKYEDEDDSIFYNWKF